jgi:hypothetical protein
MAVEGARHRFALDHNFPGPVLQAFAALMPKVDLVPITDIDRALADLDDWELLVALHRREPRWDGLITNDDKLLALPKEMTVLSQTQLTLVVVKGEGHNPIRAVGLLLCHLAHVCHQTRPDRAQVWLLRAAQKNADAPRVFLERIAEKKATSVEAIVQEHRLPAKELRRG